jgi:hypothetical protein
LITLGARCTPLRQLIIFEHKKLADLCEKMINTAFYQGMVPFDDYLIDNTKLEHAILYTYAVLAFFLFGELIT